ncbi:MAG: hypothetical protein AB9873_12615 [Syntrophobacteraceae bacterium]
MKKFIASIAVGAMVLVGAGQALAAFSTDLELIRVVYDRTSGKEVATDLLTVSAGANSAGTWTTQTVGGGELKIELGDFGASTKWSDLNVAYFAINRSSDDFWGTSDNQIQNIQSGAKLAALESGVNNVLGVYRSADTDSNGQAVVDSSLANTYWRTLNSNGTLVGRFVGIYTVTGLGEVNLGALADSSFSDGQHALADASVTQYLQFFNTPNTNGSSGTLAAIIKTNSDGSTTIVNPVPVPPSVLLLGSGILGLLGIRRRSAVA